jgi:hypothetical protein
MQMPLLGQAINHFSVFKDILKMWDCVLGSKRFVLCTLLAG